jgi:hypothetical protein
MRNYYVIIFLFALSLTSCKYRRIIDCTEEAEVNRAIEFSMNHFLNVREWMDNMDVFCRQEDPYPNAQCIIQWSGGGPHDARFDVRDDIAPQCVLHEALHLELYRTVDDHCSSHKETCGWNERRLEELNKLFASGAL